MNAFELQNAKEEEGKWNKIDLISPEQGWWQKSQYPVITIMLIEIIELTCSEVKRTSLGTAAMPLVLTSGKYL